MSSSVRADEPGKPAEGHRPQTSKNTWRQLSGVWAIPTGIQPGKCQMLDTLRLVNRDGDPMARPFALGSELPTSHMVSVSPKCSVKHLIKLRAMIDKLPIQAFLNRESQISFFIIEIMFPLPPARIILNILAEPT